MYLVILVPGTRYHQVRVHKILIYKTWYRYTKVPCNVLVYLVYLVLVSWYTWYDDLVPGTQKYWCTGVLVYSIWCTRTGVLVHGYTRVIRVHNTITPYSNIPRIICTRTVPQLPFTHPVLPFYNSYRRQILPVLF